MTTPEAPAVQSLPRPRIYVASRASVPERPALWRAFRDEGYPIISTWIDEAGPGETADLGELWQRIEHEVTTATALVLYATGDDFPLKGAYVEVGMALAAGVPVFAVCPGVKLEHPSYSPLGSWLCHPLVRRFPNVYDALDAAFRIPPAVQKVEGLIPGWSKLTEAQQADFKRHVWGLTADDETYPMPEHGWTCFHCGAHFHTPGAARLHFGEGPKARPLCSADEIKAAIRDHVQMQFNGHVGHYFVPKSLDLAARAILNLSLAKADAILGGEGGEGPPSLSQGAKDAAASLMRDMATAEDCSHYLAGGRTIDVSDFRKRIASVELPVTVTRYGKPVFIAAAPALPTVEGGSSEARREAYAQVVSDALSLGASRLTAPKFIKWRDELTRRILAVDGGSPRSNAPAPPADAAATEEPCSAGLCEDCPPADYCTDETRCSPCPRRKPPTEAGQRSEGGEG